MIVYNNIIGPDYEYKQIHVPTLHVYENAFSDKCHYLLFSDRLTKTLLCDVFSAFSFKIAI